jgi:hypothetical protein
MNAIDESEMNVIDETGKSSDDEGTPRLGAVPGRAPPPPPMKLRLPTPSYANIMATIALFLALGGSAYATVRVTSAEVVDNSLTGVDVMNGTVGYQDLTADLQRRFDYFETVITAKPLYNAPRGHLVQRAGATPALASTTLVLKRATTVTAQATPSVSVPNVAGVSAVPVTCEIRALNEPKVSFPFGAATGSVPMSAGGSATWLSLQLTRTVRLVPGKYAFSLTCKATDGMVTRATDMTVGGVDFQLRYLTRVGES